MKIGLINPKRAYHYKTDESTGERFVDNIGGIGYIEASLRKGGYNSTTINLMHDKNASIEQLEDCDIIGITSSIDCYGFFKKNLTKLKDQKKKIIVGGSLISSYGLNENNFLMKTFPEIDFGIIGEGEITTLDLIKYLDKKNLSLPRGIVYREKGKLKTTEKVKQISNLDELPDINYQIWNGLAEAVRGNLTDFMTTRGCYNACSFCFKNFPGVRTFSLSRIDREIGKIKEMNPDMLWFSDDTFLYDQERAINVGKLSQKHDLKYICHSRVNEANLETLKELKRTGCELLCYGIESFDENILKRSHKNITKAQIYNAIGLTKQAGINALGFLIIGLPGENKKSLETTIKGIEETRIIPRVRLLLPLPGTKIYTGALRKGRIEKLSLLKRFAKKEYDPVNGTHVLANLSDGLSDEELIEARDRINEIREKN